MKIVVNKLVGDLGEQWAVEYNVPSDVLKAKGENGPAAAIKEAMAPILRVLDDRLLEMNLRLIDHNRAVQSLDPAGVLGVRQCVEIMYGRRQPATPGEQTPVIPEQTGDPAVAAEKAGNALEAALEGVDQG